MILTAVILLLGVIVVAVNWVTLVAIYRAAMVRDKPSEEEHRKVWRNSDGH